jgi:hypothetical protein
MDLLETEPWAELELPVPMSISDVQTNAYHVGDCEH